MAMDKPVITGDSPALRQVFTQKEHIYLVARADGQAIAQAIRVLAQDDDLRNQIASSGNELYNLNYNLDALGNKFIQHLHQLVSE